MAALESGVQAKLDETEDVFAFLRSRGVDYVDVRGAVADRLERVATLIDPLFAPP